jgi:hypothetical protein
MKVEISQIRIFHKLTKVEITIPSMEPDEIKDYLNKNSDLWFDKLATKYHKESTHERGFGIDVTKWRDKNESDEWKYNCKELNFGGYLV